TLALRWHRLKIAKYRKPKNKAERRQRKRRHPPKLAKSPSMASTAAVPFWRSAGMTYISYSNICANIVRNCLKEPHKSDALAREKVHFTVTKWSEGKPEKPSTTRSDDPDV
ncbi:unnamed protein product, partial [Linum tenue]